MFAAAEFWVGVAFVVFFGILAYYGVPKMILAALDKRGARIAEELNEARRLREDAEALVKEFEAKRIAAEADAAAIVENARLEAERLAAEAEAKLTDFVQRRTAAAEARIAQAENQAFVEVRQAAADAALKASETVLKDTLRGQAADAYLQRSLGDVKAHLN